jgi:hypothetical protein
MGSDRHPGRASGGHVRPDNADTPPVAATVGSGSLFGALAVGCPVCNKIVVMPMGVSGAPQWWAPLQPVLGIAGVGLLLYALHRRLRGERLCALPPVPPSRRRCPPRSPPTLRLEPPDPASDAWPLGSVPGSRLVVLLALAACPGPISLTAVTARLRTAVNHAQATGQAAPTPSRVDRRLGRMLRDQHNQIKPPIRQGTQGTDLPNTREASGAIGSPDLIRSSSCGRVITLYFNP